jgi:hypothetical protein
MRTLKLPLLLAAAALAAPSAASAKAPFCQHKAGDTLYRGSDARVFQRVTQSKKDPDADTARIYACKPGSRSVRRLDTFRNNLDLRYSIRQVLVGRGRWVVMDVYSASGVSEGRNLFEYDLTTGKRQFVYATDAGDETPAVVTSGGGIALLRAGGVVLAFDVAGRRVLETGAASDLAAAGSRAYWTVGGLAKAAVLDGAPSGRIEEPSA